MAQQISESELVLMKIIWKNGGAALYSLIMEETDKPEYNRRRCAGAI